MKKLSLLSLVLCLAVLVHAQDTTPVVAPKGPSWYLNTDIVYDIESIPTIGFEHFFTKNNKLRGLRVDLGYQVHYNDTFGVVFSHGDKISVGVYQGPVARVGYSFYSAKHRRKWHNYFSPGLGVKYLWYDHEYVNTGHRFRDPSFRIQSEQCFAAIPQFTIGSKHTNKHFCADFYAGLQLPVKYRNITVYQEEDNHGRENHSVPYSRHSTMVSIAPVFGIRIGYIK